MRTDAEVAEVLDLARRGCSASKIARLTGCPRSTIRTWLRGQTPAKPRGAPSCARCGGVHRDPDEVAASYVYLLGVYLGDGCISSHSRGVHRLRIVCDRRYPALVEESCAAIAEVAPRNKVGRQLRSGGFQGSGQETNVEVSSYAKWWPCVFPQHGPGRKHERRIVFEDWQERLVDEHPGRLLRGLIHSDGCRFINTGTNWRSPRYSFSNRSEDIRRIFCDACDRLGLHWTLAPHTVYVSRKADVARLDGFVGPKR